MKQSFDAVSYVINVGRELVNSFAAAGDATTPGLVGSAREASTRKKLQSILPKGIAVGSGCVIDSRGGTSRQMDIVLYEKHLCPVYSINDDRASTYYPCEGVIAVGEIKSRMASADLEDSFAKIASVKMLRRHFVRLKDEHIPQGIVPFRKYGSPNSIVGVEAQEFDQDSKPTDQIFGFALAGSLGLNANTLCAKYVEFAAKYKRVLSPNLIVTLDDDQVLTPLQIPPDRHNPKISISPLDANAMYCVTNPQRGFQFLISQLYSIYRQGRTVEESAFDRYFADDGRLTLPNNGSCERLSSSDILV